MRFLNNKLFIGLSLLFAFALPLISQNQEVKFAPKGLVAYAASYTSKASNEPKYNTQNSKTFQYLNLGATLDIYRGDSVKVGIIDSGINYDHEDFMVNNSTKVKGDSKYYAYQSSSWVYYKASQHGYSYIDDTLGHGTNVAATVAAAINSVGGTGLAPNVELYVYKVTNSNNGYEFGAIQNALLDAKTLGLDVINMSFQSYEHEVSYGGHTMSASTNCSTILNYYLNQAYNAGITLVGAAGNYNTDEPSYPGSSNHVINVGSLNETGTDKASFSNYGSTIDVVAPGYVYVADEDSNSSYTNTQGTSFSAPLVTAAIALYIQQNPSATPSEIEEALYDSCDPIDDSGSIYANWAGHGTLNVSKFLGLDNKEGPTSITVNNPEIVDGEVEIHAGNPLDLSWTVEGTGTFDDSVNFYTLSGNEDVVSVSSTGRITAVSEGSDYVVIESNVDSNVYTYVYVTVKNSRTVLEESTYLIATVSWSSETATVTPSNAVSVTTGGSTTFEDNSMRLGATSKTGSITISSSTSNISKVVVNAKSYGSDSNVNLSIGGTDNTITSSYTDYIKEFATATNSVTIATTANKKRAHIKSVKIYYTSIVDISGSSDCVGLESFISNYMHMDYTSNLGYCKDNDHHYYSSAKEAFNNLNNHQRTLFTSNTAYLSEWNRLSTWATINGDNLNVSNLLVKGRIFVDEIIESNSALTMIVTISISTLFLLTSCLIFKKRKADKKY